MEKVIYKYKLENLPIQSIEMPSNFKVVHVGEQERFLTFWAEVDISSPKEFRTFYIIMTGGYVESTWEYCGTVQMSFHGLVVHLYLLKNG